MHKGVDPQSERGCYDVLVVGAGAGGVFCAVRTAEKFLEIPAGISAHGVTAPSLRLAIIEQGSQPLMKVRISGGGRCNVTHHCYDPHLFIQNYPRGARELIGPMLRFGALETVAWFESRGLKLYAQDDGRIFPSSNDSSTVIELLMSRLSTLGIDLKLNHGVAKIEFIEGVYRITLKSGDVCYAKNIVIATGSHPSGQRFAQQLGHAVTPAVPSLFTFNIPSPQLLAFAGVSISQARVTLKLPSKESPDQHLIDEEAFGKNGQRPMKSFKKSVGAKKREYSAEGPLLVTHWGLSGPAILKLSAWAARELAECKYHCAIMVDWLPSIDYMSLEKLLLLLKKSEIKCEIPIDRFQDRLSPSNKKIEESFCERRCFPKRLWSMLLERAGVRHRYYKHLKSSEVALLIEMLKRGTYPVEGKSTNKSEFVTCGGVRLDEISFKSMESKRMRGLFFVGEVLDIDGVTGGFNFQAAWTGGEIAASALVDRLRESTEKV